MLGARVIVDSDGQVEDMVPWLEAVGVEGILPLERQAGVDGYVIRSTPPRFAMIGHFDKMVLLRVEQAIRGEFDRLLPLMRAGRFIPSVDHQTRRASRWTSTASTAGSWTSTPFEHANPKTDRCDRPGLERRMACGDRPVQRLGNRPPDRRDQRPSRHRVRCRHASSPSNELLSDNSFDGTALNVHTVVDTIRHQLGIDFA